MIVSTTVNTTKLNPFISYVRNEPIFDGLLFRCNKIFLKSSFKNRLSARWSTLLLLPFESKLVNYSNAVSLWRPFMLWVIYQFKLKMHQKKRYLMDYQYIYMVRYKNVLLRLSSNSSKIGLLHTYEVTVCINSFGLNCTSGCNTPLRRNKKKRFLESMHCIFKAKCIVATMRVPSLLVSNLDFQLPYLRSKSFLRLI